MDTCSTYIHSSLTNKIYLSLQRPLSLSNVFPVRVALYLILHPEFQRWLTASHGISWLVLPLLEEEETQAQDQWDKKKVNAEDPTNAKVSCQFLPNRPGDSAESFDLVWLPNFLSPLDKAQLVLARMRTESKFAPVAMMNWASISSLLTAFWVLGMVQMPMAIVKWLFKAREPESVMWRNLGGTPMSQLASNLVLGWTGQWWGQLLRSLLSTRRKPMGMLRSCWFLTIVLPIAMICCWDHCLVHDSSAWWHTQPITANAGMILRIIPGCGLEVWLVEIDNTTPSLVQFSPPQAKNFGPMAGEVEWTNLCFLFLWSKPQRASKILVHSSPVVSYWPCILLVILECTL